MESLIVYRFIPPDSWDPICNLYYDSEYDCDVAAKAIWNFLMSAPFCESVYRVVGWQFDCETFGVDNDDDEDSESLCPA